MLFRSVLNVGQQFGFNPQTMQMALGAVGLPLGILSGLNTLGASVANSARFGAARDKALSQSGYTTPAQQSEVVSGYMSGAPVSLYGMDAYKSLADLQTKARGWPTSLTGYISRALGAPIRALTAAMTPAVDDSPSDGVGGMPGTAFGRETGFAAMGVDSGVGEATRGLASVGQRLGISGIGDETDLEGLSPAARSAMLGVQQAARDARGGGVGGGYADSGYSGGSAGSYGEAHGGHQPGFSPAAEEGWGRAGGWGDIGGGDDGGMGGRNDGSTGGGIAGGSIGGAGDDGYGGL